MTSDVGSAATDIVGVGLREAGSVAFSRLSRRAPSRSSVAVSGEGLVGSSVSPVSAPVAVPSPDELPPSSDLPPSLGGRAHTIVVIDDNPGITELMHELLGMLGHECHEAHDGTSGVELVREIGPDVIFVDIGLPDFDGHELTRRVRALALPRRPLIVAVSGWGHAEDVARSRAAGCDLHFVKPIDVATLEGIVGRAS